MLSEHPHNTIRNWSSVIEYYFYSTCEFHTELGETPYMRFVCQPLPNSA